MNAVEAIKFALQFGDSGMRAIEDMSSDPLSRPGEFGGNHPLWIAGHMALTEGRLQKILHGAENPLEHWKPLFDWGSEPVDDISRYPQLEEVLRSYKSLRTQTLKYMDDIGETGLNKPPAIQPPGLGGFGTVGQAIMVIACHQCFHMGEAAVARRASGKSPMFVPSAELKDF